MEDLHFVDPSWTRWVDLEPGDLAVVERDGELSEAMLVASRADDGELVFLRMAWWQGLNVHLFKYSEIAGMDHPPYRTDRTVEGSGWVLQRG